MADLIHSGKRRHVKIVALDAQEAERAVQNATVSTSGTNMIAQLNTDPADGGAADNSIVDVIHNGLAPGSAPVDVELIVEADADLGEGVVNITGRMPFTIMPEDVPAPPLATTISLSPVGEEIDRL